MYIYNSIPHITNTLNLGKDLLEVLFEKRKSLPFRYDYALDIIDENKLNILIEREVIRRNGPYIEMDEHYLSFSLLFTGFLLFRHIFICVSFSPCTMPGVL